MLVGGEPPAGLFFCAEPGSLDVIQEWRDQSFLDGVLNVVGPSVLWAVTATPLETTCFARGAFEAGESEHR
jgi:hypothetical protein